MLASPSSFAPRDSSSKLGSPLGLSSVQLYYTVTKCQALLTSSSSSLQGIVQTSLASALASFVGSCIASPIWLRPPPLRSAKLKRAWFCVDFIFLERDSAILERAQMALAALSVRSCVGSLIVIQFTSYIVRCLMFDV